MFGCHLDRVSEGEDHVPSSKMQEITVVVVVFGPTKNKWMTLPSMK